MGRPAEARFEQENSTAKPAEAHPFQNELEHIRTAQARAPRTEQPYANGASQAEKDFVDSARAAQRIDMKVESGVNLSTGNLNGKALASSETLMRAEANMVYSWMNGKDQTRSQLAIDSLKGQTFDPKNEESVYKAYLASQAAKENVTGTITPAKVEQMRWHNAYEQQK